MNPGLQNNQEATNLNTTNPSTPQSDQPEHAAPPVTGASPSVAQAPPVQSPVVDPGFGQPQQHPQPQVGLNNQAENNPNTTTNSTTLQFTQPQQTAPTPASTVAGANSGVAQTPSPVQPAPVVDPGFGQPQQQPQVDINNQEAPNLNTTNLPSPQLTQPQSQQTTPTPVVAGAGPSVTQTPPVQLTVDSGLAQPAQPPQMDVPAQPQESSSLFQASPTSPSNNQPKISKKLILIGVVILVIILGIATFFVLSANTKNSNVTEVPSSTVPSTEAAGNNNDHDNSKSSDKNEVKPPDVKVKVTQ